MLMFFLHDDVDDLNPCFMIFQSFNADELQVDFQFTFNLSKDEDKHIDSINFMVTPHKQDIDADFIITCSSNASMNLTFIRSEF